MRILEYILYGIATFVFGWFSLRVFVSNKWSERKKTNFSIGITVVLFVGFAIFRLTTGEDATVKIEELLFCPMYSFSHCPSAKVTPVEAPIKSEHGSSANAQSAPMSDADRIVPKASGDQPAHPVEKGNSEVPIPPTASPTHEDFAPTNGSGKYKPGYEFQDCSECPKMVVVPSGSALIGDIDSSSSKHKVWVQSLPPMKVTIGYKLALGKFEVTRREWAACVRDRACPALRSEYTGYYIVKMKLTDLDPAMVSYREAHGYLRWLSAKSGREYRLPSEVEWEYGARGGTTTEFWYGRDFDPTKQNKASYVDLGTSVSNEPRPVEVGRFPPNPYGLYDVYGNLSEWVEDCYVVYFSSTISATQAGTGLFAPLDSHPTDGSAYTDHQHCLDSGGTINGTHRQFAYYVVRGGGSVIWDQVFPSSIARDRADADLRHDGIRVAVTVKD